LSVAPGSRLGPYEVGDKLGEGGMGEVWRATDTRLRRQVAIKVLPAAFTEDRERLARFEREAQLLAQLQHPNVASIYGLEESGGVRALVMELVEGPTLAEKLAQGALPVEDALAIARQVAEALEAAHEKGIVHRDLKPQNIKAGIDGTVKVLDFGLAKAMESGAGAAGPAGSPTLMNSPTLTAAHATELGVILGTAAYMSPEQARGKAVDRRADIWAFGVVLYEMLAGRRCFEGGEVSDVLAAVLRQEVDWSALPQATPPRLRRLLERCLDRDPRQRLRDIGEARIEIGRIESGAADGASGVSPSRTDVAKSRRERVAWIALVGVSLLAAVLGFRGWTNRGAAEEARHPVRLAFLPPDGVLADEGAYDAAVISPDGRQLVFTGRSAGGKRRLWVRSLDSLEARALPDTDEAIEPFWSADGRSIGFGAGGKLKRVDLAGGNAGVIADAPRLTGGAWSDDGVIVYSPDYNNALYRVPATGGERKLLHRPDPAKGEIAYYSPGFLPDGRRYYFRVQPTGGGASRYLVGALDSEALEPLVDDVSTAVFALPHWLLFARNEALFAQRLDPASLAARGEPVLLAGGLLTGTGFGSSRYSVSDNGVLVLKQPRGHRYQLAWYGRDGRRLGTVGAPVENEINFQTPKLSPDGRYAVVQRGGSASRNQDIWAIDLERGSETRLTTDPGFDQVPLFSPDSRTVYFSRRGLLRVSTSGGGEERLTTGVQFAKDVSPDGKFLIFGQRGETTRSDIWALPLDVRDGKREPFPLLEAPFSEYEPRVSPDGRWLAYNSDVTGRDEIYVRPISADWKLGEATQVSTRGGLHPCWRRDGRELFYVSAPATLLEGRIMAVPVRSNVSTFEAGAPVELFQVAMFPNALTAEYDVSADGERFLVGVVEGVTSPSSVSLVLDWDAELPR
jgi:Tol biopolymer transport system component